MTSDTDTARDLTRRIVRQETASGDAGVSAAVAVHAASERACASLAKSLGAVGFDALLRRALAQREGDHPLLRDIRVGRVPDSLLGGIPEIIETHGSAATVAALEAMLDSLFNLLGRLIGIDMVAQLVERRGPAGTHDQGVK